LRRRLPTAPLPPDGALGCVCVGPVEVCGDLKIEQVDPPLEWDKDSALAFASLLTDSLNLPQAGGILVADDGTLPPPLCAAVLYAATASGRPIVAIEEGGGRFSPALRAHHRVCRSEANAYLKAMFRLSSLHNTQPPPPSSPSM
jgi:hypothetical protein